MNNEKNEKKKILTLADLYNFYSNKNENCIFNSAETGYKLAVQVPAQFEINKEQNDNSLLFCLVKLMHSGENRNHSSVTDDALVKASKTLAYKPILANFVEYTDPNTNEVLTDFTSHDMEITEDGTVYYEHQIGCFTADEPYFEIEEETGHNFLYGYCAIPREYTAACSVIERKNGTKISVELEINEMQYSAKDKVLELTDINILGATCLGKNPDTLKDIEEGMKNARLDIADFKLENNSTFSKNNIDTTLNTKLIETLEKLNTTLSNFNINHAVAEETFEEGGNTKVNNEKFLELLEKYNKTEDDIDFEVEGLSDEELESKFEEKFGKSTSAEGEEEPKEPEEPKDPESQEGNPEEDPKEPENDPDADPENDPEEPEENLKDNNACGTKKKKKRCSRTYEFELSHDDIRYALYNLLAPYEEADNDYYWIVSVFDDYFVYQGYNGNYFGQKYSVEDDNVAFDGERYELYPEFLTKSEKTELENMRSNYSSISDQLAKYQDAETKAQKEEILADKAYSRFMEDDAFKAIVENADSLSVEELRTKCELTFAKLVKEHGNFAMKEEPETKRKNKIGINTNFEASTDSEPYGDYFKSLEV